MKLKALIPIEKQVGDIYRLEIQTDETDTGGIFLYSFYSQDEAYDAWYENIEDVFNYTLKTYNIKKEDWEIL